MKIIKLGKVTIENENIVIDTVQMDAEGGIMTDTEALVAIREHVYRMFTAAIRGEKLLSIGTNELYDTEGNPVPQDVMDHFYQISKKGAAQ